MKQINVYLTFDGDCREAMTFYADCLGVAVEIIPFGDIPNTPPEAGDRVMHARMAKGAAVLMASDCMPGMRFSQGNSFAVSVDCESAEEVDRLYAALVAGGVATMPPQDQFWGAYFAMLTDKFGVMWMFNFDKPKSSYAGRLRGPADFCFKESAMSKVRVLVGTRKGAFVLSSDGKRDKWEVSGPHFAGWEVYHVKGSPVDPNRVYASQSSAWFGQVIQRSDDGGKTWAAMGNKFAYDGIAGTHQWYDGTPHPWEFKRVWHLEPSLTDAEMVYAGIEDAALFRSGDGGQSWTELSGLRGHGSGPHWMPGAGGMCLHTIVLDPSDAKRMYIAISAAGAFRTDDGGATWKPINQGLRSLHIPDPTAEVGHCVHHIAMHPQRPGVLFMQKHWDVMRSDDAGDHWTEVSGDLPTDFGFCIDVHAHEPETIYVVPIKSDGEHFPLDGKLQVFRSRSGGNEWEPLTKGLPQSDCYVNVLRDAMAVDTLDTCGIYFGTTGGQVYCSPDGGDSWKPIVRDLPAVLSVEVQTLEHFS